MLLKMERVILAFGYMVLLAIGVRNIWQYLYLQQMYKSYTILVSYILLVALCIAGTIYEYYMGFACGQHDCVS